MYVLKAIVFLKL